MNEVAREGSLLDVSALIPAFNEELTLRKIVNSTKRFVSEVLVVNDHSTDDTETIARRTGARVLRNTFDRGRHFAHLFGIRSIENEIIVTLNADGQHLPEKIPRLLEPIRRGNQTTL